MGKWQHSQIAGIFNGAGESRGSRESVMIVMIIMIVIVLTSQDAQPEGRFESY